MSVNTDRDRKRLLAFCSVLLAIVVLGELCVYTMSYTDYDAAVKFEDGQLQYDVSAVGAKNYAIVVSDNEGNPDYVPVRTIYLYRDASYPSYNRNVDNSDGQSIVEDHYLDQLTKHLKYRNITDIQYAGANDLKSMMEESIQNDACYGIGVVFVSGVFPEPIYTGNKDDVLMRWMEHGGTIYWAVGMLGQKYGAANGDMMDVPDFQELFFSGNKDCLNMDEGVKKAYDDIPGNGYREALCLSNNNLYRAVITDNLKGVTYLPLGYQNEEGHIASNISVQYGNGAFVVIGGHYSLNGIYDMAQIIASGVSPWSTLSCVINGVVSGTVSGTHEVGADCVTVYAFLGGYFPVYGDNYYYRLTKGSE